MKYIVTGSIRLCLFYTSPLSRYQGSGYHLLINFLYTWSFNSHRTQSFQVSSIVLDWLVQFLSLFLKGIRDRGLCIYYFKLLIFRENMAFKLTSVRIVLHETEAFKSYSQSELCWCDVFMSLSSIKRVDLVMSVKGALEPSKTGGS